MKELKPFLISLLIVSGLFFAIQVNAQTQFRIERSLVPETDSLYYLGTTTPSLRAWLRVIADSFYDTDALDGCATWSSNVLTSTGSACGSGSGGGNSKWATSTPATDITPNAGQGVVMTNATTTSATTTNLRVSGSLNLFGTIGTALSDFCVAITGGAGLCDGTDSTGSGGTGLATSTDIADTYVIYGTSASDVGGEAAFTYNDATNLLTVGDISATNATTTSLAVSGITSAIPLTNANGSFLEYAGTSCTNQFVRSLSALGSATCASVANTDLTNSTISGIALGSNLADLTAGTGITSAGTYNGGTARTFSVDQTFSPTWTGAHIFDNITRSTTTQATTTSLAVSNITSAIPLTNANGTFSEYAGTSCTNQFVRSLSALGVATCATVANTDLANSTISGVSLGSNLNSLSNGSTLLGTSYNGSATVSDWDIDLSNQNVWTSASTTFVGGVTIGTATATQATTTSLRTTTLGVGTDYITDITGTGLAISGNALNVSNVPNASLANSTISGIALGSNLANLTATDTTLTFSGTYNGSTARTIGLNLSNANTWTGGQIFANSTTTNATTTSFAILNLTQASCDVKALTTGVIYCGTDATGSGGAASIATSTAETSGRIPFWTSTAATPATLSGGVAGFTFDSGTAKLTVTNSESTNATTTNATTTNFYISGAINGWEDIKTTLYASSTLDVDGAYAPTGTTTYIFYHPKSAKLKKIGCRVVVGSGNARFTVGNGTASSTVACTTTLTTSATEVTVSADAPYYVSWGNAGTTAEDTVFSVYEQLIFGQ